MALTNSNISYTGLVEKYVGSAYDKMAHLSDNLPALLELVEAIETGDLEKIADIAHLIPIVIEDIAEFQELYFGSAPIHPTESPAGNPIQAGAMYFNNIENRMYLYTNDAWIRLGESSRTVVTVMVDASMTTDGGSTYVIPIVPSYIIGAHTLGVFLERVGYDGPVLQMDKVTDPITGTYDETTVDSITFLGSDISEGNTVTYQVLIGEEQISHTVEVIQKITSITSDGVTQVTLPDGQTYTVGGKNLEVYKDRVLQVIGAGYDYTEISNTRIQFNTPIDGTATPVEIIFNIGAVISNAPSITTLMQGATPDVNGYAAGTEWFNTDKGRKSILYVDADSRQWVSTNPEHGYFEGAGIPLPPSGTQDTIFSTIRPSTDGRAQGTRWFNTDTGVEHILYLDGDSAQWLRVSGDIHGTTQ